MAHGQGSGGGGPHRSSRGKLDPRRGAPKGPRPGAGATRKASTERRERPPRSEPEPSRYPPVHLDDDLVRQLRATARPGKGEILVKVFADAAAAFAAEDFAEAVRLGDQAKHIALRSAPVREFLGLAFYRAGRWAEAARELAAYRRLSGSHDQNAVLADTYRALGKPQKALEYADEVPERGTDPAVYYETQIVAAGALSDMGRIDDAIARLEPLDLQPEVVQEHHFRAWYVLADLLEHKGRYTQARELFEAVAAADEGSTDAEERLRKLR